MLSRNNVEVSKYHKSKTAEFAHKAFYSEIDFASKTHIQSCSCNQKVTDEMKTKARLLQFQTHAKAIEL